MIPDDLPEGLLKLIPQTAQWNDDGQVAIRYAKQAPVIIRVNGKDLFFAVRASISMAWIDPEDVPGVLATTVSCCGGTRHRGFIFTDETHVRRWTNGGGR